MDNCSTKILVAAVVPVHTHWSPHDTILWKSVISFINSALLGCHKKSKDRKFFFQIKRRQRRNFLGVTKKEQRLEDSLKKGVNLATVRTVFVTHTLSATILVPVAEQFW